MSVLDGPAVRPHTPAGGQPAPHVDGDQFRRLMARYCTGVVVVTGTHRSVPAGLTCQSFASLSLRPPLVMFACATTSDSWRRIRAGGRFAVNILSDRQEAVSRAFARPGGDKFAGVRWWPGRYGCPLLADALGHLECALEAVHPGGDHDIVVGRVLALSSPADGGRSALLYFRSRYRHLSEYGEV